MQVWPVATDNICSLRWNRTSSIRTGSTGQLTEQIRRHYLRVRLCNTLMGILLSFSNGQRLFAPTGTTATSLLQMDRQEIWLDDLQTCYIITRASNTAVDRRTSSHRNCYEHTTHARSCWLYLHSSDISAFLCFRSLRVFLISWFWSKVTSILVFGRSHSLTS